MHSYYSTIGAVCQILDETNVDYHHCKTWFRLFLDKTYGVTIRESNFLIEVYVCDEDRNTKCFIAPSKPKIFEGNIENFTTWLYTITKLASN